MNSHGILMSGEMMRAYLAGRKNQTRRARGLALINEKPDDWVWKGMGGNGEFVFLNTHQPAFPQQRIKPPYGYIGDELWFKETHAVYTEGDVVCYRATDSRPKDVKWTPSIFMKRIHTRVVTRVIEVRVERVRDISEMDAMNPNSIYEEMEVAMRL